MQLLVLELERERRGCVSRFQKPQRNDVTNHAIAESSRFEIHICPRHASGRVHLDGKGERSGILRKFIDEPEEAVREALVVRLHHPAKRSDPGLNWWHLIRACRTMS